MENKFKDVMFQKSDEQLIKIVSVDSKDYDPLAVEAAQQELNDRNISASEIEEVKQTTLVQKKKEKEVKYILAGQLTRLLILIIDVFVYFILVIIFTFIIAFVSIFIDLNLDSNVMGLIVSILTYLLYYIIFEASFQKTIGKMITNTRVVMDNGDKPSVLTIIARTFYRLIPFDWATYLFNSVGLHDSLSKTRVISKKIIVKK